ncbi:hypothetical protein [Indiicoccus explosivorum]|uniref:hypothetical protein n=1 Tax=Indiicoccus explosivorum TaxID=1917864 RepID=UPI000B447DC0|nr:hypothetical protein [Indiicoccus explosivorum]
MIRQELAKWQEMTAELTGILKSGDERESVIENVVELLAAREELKGSIQGPFTPEEELFGEQLVMGESELTNLMAQLQDVIKGDLSRAKKAKVNMNSYTNPYGGFSPDGTYYDQRK